MEKSKTKKVIIYLAVLVAIFYCLKSGLNRNDNSGSTRDIGQHGIHKVLNGGKEYALKWG